MNDPQPNPGDDIDLTIDSMLQEYLSKKSPKPLDADVVAAALARSSFESSMESNRIDQVCNRAAEETRLFLSTGLLFSHSSATPAVTLASKETANRSLFSRIAIGFSAAVAASLMIYAASLVPIKQPELANSNQNAAVAEPKTQLAETTNDVETPTVAANVSPKVEQKAAPEQKSFGPESLPFRRDQDKSVARDNRESAKPSKTWTANHEQTLATINSQFEQLWKRLGFDAQEAVPFTEWKRRVAAALINEPNSTVIDELESLDNRNAQVAYIDRLMSSDKFVNLWSDRIAREFFKLAAVRDNNAADAIRKARESIAKSIRSDRPLVDLWNEFLAVDDMSDAKGAWWLAHRDADAKSKSAMLIGLSSGHFHACVQCHRDSDATTVAVKEESVEQYWHLAGLLHKLELKPDAKAEWKLSKELFYEGNDGSMRLAAPGKVQANATISEVQLSQAEDANDALDSWVQSFVRSNVTHEEFVDVLWSALFHGRLASDLADQPEFSELTELRSFLASVNKDQSLSLRELLKTLVMSNVFTVPGAEPTGEWYLMASESNIEQLRQQLKTFARFAPRPDETVASNDRLLAWLSEMNRPAPMALAQPRPMDFSATAATTAKERGEMKAGQLDWLIRSQHPSVANAAFVESISAADLDWPQVVDHLYLAMRGRYANDSEQVHAKRLLEISVKRDIALRRLMASLSM